VTAYGVNQLCGSGLRTVALAYQAIRNGDSEIVVAGGQESMSRASSTAGGLASRDLLKSVLPRADGPANTLS
jgi:acetyl-CoA acetyltransferase